jgi:hypothetical protein
MNIEKNYERIIKKNKKIWIGLIFCKECMYYGKCPYRTIQQIINNNKSGNRKNCPYWKEYKKILRRKNENRIRKKVDKVISSQR